MCACVCVSIYAGFPTEMGCDKVGFNVGNKDKNCPSPATVDCTGICMTTDPTFRQRHN